MEAESYEPSVWILIENFMIGAAGDEISDNTLGVCLVNTNDESLQTGMIDPDSGRIILHAFDGAQSRWLDALFALSDYDFPKTFSDIINCVWRVSEQRRHGNV